MRFRTVVDLKGMTATGLNVPEEVVLGLGSGKRAKVKVTINGYTYRSSVAPMCGVYMIPLAAEHRNAAQVSAGEEIEVQLELDTEPREVEVPEDLATALESQGLRLAFEKLAYTMRKEHVRSIEEAKAPETRLRRIEKALASLR